jgi:hypothetical protein
MTPEERAAHILQSWRTVEQFNALTIYQSREAILVSMAEAIRAAVAEACDEATK